MGRLVRAIAMAGLAAGMLSTEDAAEVSRSREELPVPPKQQAWQDDEVVVIEWMDEPGVPLPREPLPPPADGLDADEATPPLATPFDLRRFTGRPIDSSPYSTELSEPPIAAPAPLPDR